jgi:hypothetical protein
MASKKLMLSRGVPATPCGMDPAITLRRLPPAAACAAAPLALLLLLPPGGTPGIDRAALMGVGMRGLLRGTKRRVLPLVGTRVMPAAPAAAPAAAGPGKLNWPGVKPWLAMLSPIRNGIARPWNAEAGPFLRELCWPSTNSGSVRCPPAALLLPPPAPKRVGLRSGLGADAAAARVEVIPAGDTDRPARQQHNAPWHEVGVSGSAED